MKLINFNFLFHFRNRLESNAEHWNALLLSLRELTEWVIRKDTELSTLGHSPVRGDAASLQKQLVSDTILSRKKTKNTNLETRFVFFFAENEE